MHTSHVPHEPRYLKLHPWAHLLWDNHNLLGDWSADETSESYPPKKIGNVFSDEIYQSCK
jgi:hypothetical protein